MDQNASVMMDISNFNHVALKFVHNVAQGHPLVSVHAIMALL